MCVLQAFAHTFYELFALKMKVIVLVCAHCVVFTVKHEKAATLVCGGVHRLPTTERDFGPCGRLPGQNKFPLCGEVMMVLQRQL